MTALDTAYNYRQFHSHHELADVAGDLLNEFTISTKVGYFTDGHDLTPHRLHRAVEQTAIDLGQTPETVLIHNPEHSPSAFAAACSTMEQIRDSGLCRNWGLSSWHPQPLLAAAWEVPRPDIVMVRAGLTVPGQALDAGESLVRRTGAREVWGMSPFGGNTADPIWSTVDTSVFLAPGQDSTPLQAGLAAAFALPTVTRLAIGTSRLDHLDDLLEACQLDVSNERVKQYRSLLSARVT